jgi:cell fate (sporulation/competence/biofilm development) regulator YlbF (YheA/YmcA/DUF963 family)
MDDDEYYNHLTTQAKVRSLDDVASDVRKHLSGAVESIIKAGQALQEGRGMHPSDNAFHDWCMQEFPDLKHGTRNNIMQVSKRFGGSQNFNYHFPTSVLYELAAPSVPDELVEDIMSLDKPMKVKEVQQAKSGYKEVQNNPDNIDLKEAVKEKQKTPVEAANEAWERSEEKRKEIEAQPNVFDLGAYVKSTEHCRVDVTARCMVITMEQLVSKFDRRDIMANLHAAIREDVIGVKIPALHAMAEMLTELCEDLPIQETNLRNVT